MNSVPNRTIHVSDNSPTFTERIIIIKNVKVFVRNGRYSKLTSFTFERIIMKWILWNQNRMCMMALTVLHLSERKQFDMNRCWVWFWAQFSVKIHTHQILHMIYYCIIPIWNFEEEKQKNSDGHLDTGTSIRICWFRAESDTWVSHEHWTQAIGFFEAKISPVSGVQSPESIWTEIRKKSNKILNFRL